MKELDEMTVDELIELAKELPVKIAIKQYGVGFKDGFNDGMRAEEDKKAILMIKKRGGGKE